MTTTAREGTVRVTASVRNAALFNALRELRKTPRSPQKRETWIYAAIDLTKAVFSVQFASMRNSPDREDLEQAACLVFHKVADKLALLTDTLSPDVLFRVLYSVAKYSMFRELARLKKGSLLSYGSPQEEEDFSEEMKIALALEEDNVGEDVDSPKTVDVDRIEHETLIGESLPEAILFAIDEVNIYIRTPWGEAVKFCAVQRLCGRFPSPSFVRNYWKPPDPDLVIMYGEHVARNAILRVPEILAGA